MTTENTDTPLMADCNPLLVLPIPAAEGYPASWMHCMIHLNPETGEMHSDGDHRVRQWIQDRLAKLPLQSVKAEQPDRESVRMIRDVPLQEGDLAVECSNPGHFLKVHPDVFGKIANHPAYSYFRKKP